MNKAVLSPWRPVPYCPRCVNYIVTTGDKHCKKCRIEMRKEVNFCYDNYAWPRGKQLPFNATKKKKRER